MPRGDEPSYTDLVYEVLASVEEPLTFQEIFDQVNGRRPVATRNPKGTIRNALTRGRQLISLGGGRYGYLPHTLPETIGFGDESEAVAGAAEQLAAWQGTPGALAWLDAAG